MGRRTYSMEVQRPAISYHRGCGNDDGDDSAAEAGFLDRKGKEVIATDFVHGEIVALSDEAVVTVENLAFS